MKKQQHSTQTPDVRLNIEYFPPASLKPHPRNARRHPREQVDKLKALIQRVGYLVPVEIDATGTIHKGHCGHQAAQELGLATIPCIRLTHLAENDLTLFRNADNRLGELSEWDEAMLKLDMADLPELDIELAGFDPLAILAGMDGGGPETPAPKQPASGGIEYREKFAILVECADEAEQETLYNRLTSQGLDCKVLVN